MRQPQYIQIRMNNPCTEDWDKMTPREQGRFCDSCRKCVVDFTGYTDEELLHYFKTRNTKNLCGRFDTAQLDRKIFKPTTRRKYFQWIMSLGFVVFLTNLFGNEAKAQEPVQQEWNADSLNSQQPGKDTTSAQKTLTSEEIESMPTRNTNTVVSTSVGGFSTSDGGSIEIGGARGEGTLYIVEGVQVIGSRGINLPRCSQDDIEVPTNGTPAKYSNKDMGR